MPRRFKVRNQRQEDGTYMLSYGKGSKKLTELMSKNDDGWYAGDLGPHKSMKEAKTLWGAWAEAHYAAESDGKPESVRSSAPPRPPGVKGPPSVTRKGPPSVGRPPVVKSGPPTISVPPRVPKVQDSPVPLEEGFSADPFDPAFKYPADFPDKARAKHLTPLGVLVHIHAWAKRYETRIKEINSALQFKKPPGFNPFDTLIGGIDDCLKRELPTLTKDVTHDGTPIYSTGQRPLTKAALETALKREFETDPDDDIPF